MPKLMFLCDEMAKRGDKDFFNALSRLGIMTNILKCRRERFNDFEVTAQEHGHIELVETIRRYILNLRKNLLPYWFSLMNAIATQRMYRRPNVSTPVLASSSAMI